MAVHLFINIVILLYILREFYNDFVGNCVPALYNNI